MPSRNVYKHFVPGSFYHVYARGAGRRSIFLEPKDYNFFINLFSRYLSKKPATSPFGPYPHLANDISLLCYCLMPNHFHLLIYQKDQHAMSRLMHSVMTSYSRYFNKQHKHTGPIFESRYKANRITEDSYLIHISRYIHLNPRYWQRYPYSSIRYYLKGNDTQWLKPEQVLELFADRVDYLNFVKDYEEHKTMLDEIKTQLVD